MEEKRKVPKIRFKGFTDDWEQRKLNQFSKYITSNKTVSDIVSDGIYDLYDANSIIGKINKDVIKEEYITIIKDGSGVGKVRRLPKNTLFICTMGGIVSMNSNIDFIYCNLLRTDFTKEINGATIPHVYYSSYGNNEYYIPKIKEQNKIGMIFHNIDNLITLHQRKYEKLVNMKKSMLEKMFPKNSSKKPEIRFKGFTDDWEQRKLGETVILRGRIGFRGYKETDLVDEGNGAITFSPADINESGFISFEKNKYLSWLKYEESPEIKVRKGDILFTKTASIGKVGYVRELKEKATINPQFALLTPNADMNGYFIFLSVKNKNFMDQVKGITGGSSVPTMSQEKLKELTFMSPKYNEQTKIGELFNNIDNLITLHQRKYEKLVNMKKSMLEKMFV